MTGDALARRLRTSTENGIGSGTCNQHHLWARPGPFRNNVMYALCGLGLYSAKGPHGANPVLA